MTDTTTDGSWRRPIAVAYRTFAEAAQHAERLARVLNAGLPTPAPLIALVVQYPDAAWTPVGLTARPSFKEAVQYALSQYVAPAALGVHCWVVDEGEQGHP